MPARLARRAVGMLIDLIRHGEPVGGRRYRGQRDDPLSDEGWRQMWDAVAGRGPWDCILSSPLQRCAAFARALAERRELPVKFDDRLKEIGFGTWEGSTREQLRENDPEAFRRFVDDPLANRPPGAEPLGRFCDRVGAAWGDFIGGSTGTHGLVVAHAGVIRAILCRVLELPLASMYRIEVANASMTRVRAAPPGPPVLVFHGA